jgi:putative FmdB family regulatory protein
MPLYEYECSACAHRFEVIQKYSDAPIDICPKCGGAVSKLFSSPAIQFKGSGFYLTDYGRGGKSDIGTETAKAAKETSGSSSAGETKAAETKTETKAETKTESKPSTPST